MHRSAGSAVLRAIGCAQGAAGVWDAIECDATATLDLSAWPDCAPGGCVSTISVRLVERSFTTYPNSVPLRPRLGTPTLTGIVANTVRRISPATFWD